MSLSIYSADFCDDRFSYLMESFYHREVNGYVYYAKLSVFSNNNLLKSIETTPIHSCNNLNQYYVVLCQCRELLKNLIDNASGNKVRKNLEKIAIEMFNVLDEDCYFDNNKIKQLFKEKFIKEYNL